jgi:hypothetical protein
VRNVQFFKRILLLAATGMVLFLYSSAIAGESKEWINELTIYGWLANINGTIPLPGENTLDISYDAEDILSNLEGILMGGYEARYQKFSFIADLIYMSVNGDGSLPTGSGIATADLDITSYVITGGVGYELMNTEKGVLSVVGGLRWLDLEVETDLTRNGFPVSSNSGSQDLLDGLIGVRGAFKINEKWFLPYYADIGTGDSDYSYNLFAGIGYAFGWGDVRLGYRHLSITMEDEAFMEDMTLSGPVLGVGFRF